MSVSLIHGHDASVICLGRELGHRPAVILYQCINLYIMLLLAGDILINPVLNIFHIMYFPTTNLRNARHKCVALSRLWIMWDRVV